METPSLNSSNSIHPLWNVTPSPYLIEGEVLAHLKVWYVPSPVCAIPGCKQATLNAIQKAVRRVQLNLHGLTVYVPVELELYHKRKLPHPPKFNMFSW
jgi:hypothetical protein